MSSNARRVLILLVAVIVIGAVLIIFRPRGGGRADAIRAGFDAEFLTRPDGYPGLAEAYGFRFADDPRQLDPGLMYRAVADGAVDVICGFATDGRIAAYDLRVLTDDRHFFPPYYAAPVVREDTLAAHIEIAGVLNRLGGALPDNVMQRLNYEVDENGRSAHEVAAEFLIGQGLIPSAEPPDRERADRIAIGGKQFTEQEILGELMALMLEHHTDLNVERRLNLGSTMICFNALQAGDLDLYAEYTGTGLVNILQRDAINDPDTAYDVVRNAFAEQYDLVWLEPFGFNNTYTLTMRRDRAAELGLSTVSDLAALTGDRGDGH